MQAVEIAESQCPVRIERYGLRDNSCGDGEFRGGCGMRRDIRILADGASLSVLTDHAIIPPFGVDGGYSGDANRFVVIRNGKVVQPSPIPGKVGGFPLLKGDIVRMESAGGGGYGDPLKRDPDRVRRDVYLGYLNVKRVRDRYGVVLDNAGAVDAVATETERSRVRAGRVTIPIQLANEDELDGSRRRITVSAATAKRLGVGERDLIELTAPTSAAALRGWVHIAEQPGSDSGDAGEELRLGPLGLAILGREPGDTVELRAVKSTVS